VDANYAAQSRLLDGSLFECDINDAKLTSKYWVDKVREMASNQLGSGQISRKGYFRITVSGEYNMRALLREQPTVKQLMFLPATLEIRFNLEFRIARVFRGR